MVKVPISECIQGRIQKLAIGGTSSVCFSVQKAQSLDTEGVESETPKAPRRWEIMGRGIPLPNRLRGLGEITTLPQ